MTFPIDKFGTVSIEQVVDVKAQNPRYNRPKALGNKKPYWLLSLTSPPLDYTESMEASSLLDAYMGPLNTFALPNPLPEIVTRTGLALNADADKDETTVDIKNLPISTANACAGGDFITITGHTKVYRIVGTHASNGSGIATVTITPPLFQDVTANTAINYGDDVQFQCCLTNTLSMDVNGKNGKFMIFDVDLMEQG